MGIQTMQNFFTNLFYKPSVNALFTEQATLGYMLQFEAALALAQAEQGIIPPKLAQIISQNCTIAHIDIEALCADVHLGGNVNIPLIKQLTKAVKKADEEAAKYVHLGATSQDVIDTATMLQVRDAFFIIENDLKILIYQLKTLALEHRETPMIGRSLLQQARPITFGFKVAVWLEGVLFSYHKIQNALENGFFLQFGGAVGTHSSVPHKAILVSESISKQLKLKNPTISWHTNRSYFAEIVTILGILTGNLGKIAQDISLLMQTEVAEVFESSQDGKGGSSAMPHKRNPVSCVAILANAQRIPNLVATMLSCMSQDYERAVGKWHAEWETLADIVKLTAGALHQAVQVTNGLEVDTERMLKNLERTKGLIYAENVSLALAGKIGKTEAHQFMELACEMALQEGAHLKDVLLKEAIIKQYFTKKQVLELLKPENSLGLCGEMVDKMVKKL
jgi:3-carboxy-cis,cis-muconate cycloisomerase